MTQRTFKCRNCGYRFQDDPEGRYAGGIVTTVRGGEQKPPPSAAPVKNTVDLTCPNCGYEWEEKVEG